MKFLIKLNNKLRFIYRNYLINFWFGKIIRRFYLWLFFRIERIEIFYSKKFSKTYVFNLISLKNYSHPSKKIIKILLNDDRFNSKNPIAYGFNANFLENKQSAILSIPSISIHEICETIVISHAEGFIHEGSFIYPSIIDIERDAIKLEEDGFAKVNKYDKKIEIQKYDGSKTIDYAISLIGQCSGNYAHWLTETLPKLALISLQEEYRNVPLLIDELIHPNIVESIKKIGGGDRKIYTLPNFHWIKVKHLVYLEPTAYVPVRTRDLINLQIMPHPKPDLFIFSQPALSILRQVTYSVLRIERKVYRRNRMVFFIRTPQNSSNGRHLINQNALIKIAENYGFEILDTERLTFSDQVQIMSETQFLIGAVGAALCNCIFMPSQGIVLGLAPYFTNANGYYFSNLVSSAGQRFAFILGMQEVSSSFIVHRNYSISPEDFESTLIKYLSL
jgi:hypothetical protein